MGHANLLDTLMEKLDFGDVEDQVRPETEIPEASFPSPVEEASWGNLDLDNDEQWASDYSNSTSEDDEELITPTFDDDDEVLDLTLTQTSSKSAVVPAVQALPMLSPVAEHPLHIGEPDDPDAENSVEEDMEVDKHIQAPSLEQAESYFAEVDISQERANVAASLAAFDTGTTLSTAGST